MLLRAGWTLAGLTSVGIGGLGVIVPGLPTTVFFIVAAWCFSRSNPRLERWVLGLPRVGPMVRDHRAGLGMPRRAKLVAISMIVVFSAASVVALDATAARAAITVLALVGVVYVGWRVPTREHVLARRDVAALGPALPAPPRSCEDHRP